MESCWSRRRFSCCCWVAEQRTGAVRGSGRRDRAGSLGSPEPPEDRSSELLGARRPADIPGPHACGERRIDRLLHPPPRRDEPLVIDTRTHTDRGRAGIIAGSLHVPRTVLEWHLDPSNGYRHPRVQGFDQPLVLGKFFGGDVVELHGPGGQMIGRGVVAYDAAELAAMIGRSTADLPVELRRPAVHADDLVAV